MLERLLELVRAGGTHRITDLAHDMETTPQLVEAMLDQLRQMGYLKEIEHSCEGQCKGCSLNGTCATIPSSKVWTLTNMTRGKFAEHAPS